MNELMQLRNDRVSIRWRLLTTASIVAMAGNAVFPNATLAESGGQPSIWIELGAQMERVDGGQSAFAPGFFNTITNNGLTSPLAIDRLARYSNGLEGKVSVLPDGMDWVFAAAVRYGRSNGNRSFHQQPNGQYTRFPFGSKYLTKTAAAPYAETRSKNAESHLVVDFQAGKDVGLGLFGRDSTSVVNFGLRFAQFSQRSDATIRARPDVRLVPEAFGKYQIPVTFYHRYFASEQRSANFHGIGPSLSWDASTPIAGRAERAEITFDWGANIAVLFGRQKARAHHQSSGSYHYFHPSSLYGVVNQLPTHHGTAERSRSVVVPNVGGFAGLSFRYDDARVSVGYRADFFFGAIDGGLDGTKSYNREFYGPFATISVGLGG